MRRLETKFSHVFFFHNRLTLTAWVREIALRSFMVLVRLDFTMRWLSPTATVAVVEGWKSPIWWHGCHQGSECHFREHPEGHLCTLQRQQQVLAERQHQEFCKVCRRCPRIWFWRRRGASLWFDKSFWINNLLLKFNWHELNFKC